MSLVSLIPASIKFKTIPFKIIFPSTISLVVPGIFVTIALFSSNKEFKILLFPTFWFTDDGYIYPILIILPFLASFNNSANFLLFFLNSDEEHH